MRTLPSELTTHLATTSGVKMRQLLWVEAKNRTTGELETIGFWSGEDHQDFVIDGETRTYYGGGQFIQFGEVTLDSTLNVRKLTASVFPISPEIEVVLREYEPKMAPVETHVLFLYPETNNQVCPPVKMHKGWIDRFPIKTPPIGEEGSGALEMVNHTRMLTRRLPHKRSDDTQRKRSGSDSFYADVGMTGQVTTPWGSK